MEFLGCSVPSVQEGPFTLCIKYYFFPRSLRSFHTELTPLRWSQRKLFAIIEPYLRRPLAIVSVGLLNFAALKAFCHFSANSQSTRGAKSVLRYDALTQWPYILKHR